MSGRGAAAAVTLDPAKVDAWRIERQLLGRAKASSPVEVAERLVGVQAQVTSSAALSIALRSKAARSGRPAVAAVARALKDRRLVRSWAMRGTLHLFAADDVPTIAAALQGREMWRRPAWLRWFDVTEPEMERLIDTIGEVLDDGRPRSRAELAGEIGSRLGAKTGTLLLGSWGSALKIASDRHYLVQSADDEAGTRFVRASRWLGAWRVEDGRAALAKLVDRYLAAYGPATFKELLRWWGVAVVKAMQPAVDDLGDAVTQVTVDGLPALVRTSDIDLIESTRPSSGAVHLLGGFDPLTVGAGLRDRLIPRRHLSRVSRTAGWISPVVLSDGIVSGVWDMVVKSRTIEITVEPFSDVPLAVRSRIGQAAERVGGALGLAVELRYGAVFTAKQQAEPFIER